MTLQLSSRDVKTLVAALHAWQNELSYHTVEELARITPLFVSCYPNAGLPNAFGGFDETPEMMARTLGEFAADG